MNGTTGNFFDSGGAEYLYSIMLLILSQSTAAIWCLIAVLLSVTSYLLFASPKVQSSSKAQRAKAMREAFRALEIRKELPKRSNVSQVGDL